VSLDQYFCKVKQCEKILVAIDLQAANAGGPYTSVWPTRIGDIRLDEVTEPVLKEDGDTIVRLTASAICGTDLHLVRGTMPGMKPGTILGHEAKVELMSDVIAAYKAFDKRQAGWIKIELRPGA
jgi:threonine dehydrogenase-like Zn-dependent dehydrogenase